MSPTQPGTLRNSVRRPMSPAAPVSSALGQPPWPWGMLPALLLLAGACEKPEPPQAPLLRSVRYTVVNSESGTHGRTFSGRVRASNQSRLSFQVGGRIKRVAVKVGARVERGDPIAVLDATDFDLQIQEARASAAQARAQAEGASANYERVRALYERKNASTQDLDNARAQRDSTRSVLNATNQTIKRLQRQLGYATLSAPGAGTISELSAEANEVVGAGQVIGLLQVGEQLEVRIDLPESQIRVVEQGAEGQVRCDAAGEPELTATVHEVGVPTAGGNLFPVTVRLGASTSHKIRAGMVAEVTFNFGEEVAGKMRRQLPLTAVGEDRDGRFVYVIKKGAQETGVLERRGVEVGQLEGDAIEVSSGLEDGELVVTLGVSRVHDGLKVKVPPL